MTFRGRILAITDAPFAHTGYGNQADKVLTEFVRRGWEVYQFACNYFPTKEECEKTPIVDHKGIKVILLPKASTNGEIYPSKELVKKWYDELKPDIVWSLNDFYRVDPYLSLGQEFIDRWVHWLPIDNDMPDEMWSKRQQNMKFLVYLTDFGLQLDGNRVGDIHYKSRIYHAVPVETFYPMPNKYKIKEKHGMHNLFVVLTVGRHQPRKMIYHSARAACKFLQTNEQSIWICKADPNDSAMFSEPESERDLIKLVKSYGVEDRVMFIPHSLPDSEMRDLYNTADVFLSLTGGEGFNIPLVEAMMCGVPVIATDSTTAPELTNNWQFGYPVKVECKKQVKAFSTYYDQASISEAIQRLKITFDDWRFNSNKNNNMMGGMASEYHRHFCSASKIGDEWEEVFQRIIRYNNKVLWHSHFGRGVGFSTHSEYMITALDKLGYDIYCNDRDCKQSSVLDSKIRSLCDKYEHSNIDFTNYPQVICWQADVYNDIKGKYRIGMSIMESTKYQQHYVNIMNKLDYNFTTCEFVRKSQIEAGVTIPIKIIPPYIDGNIYHYTDRDHKGKPFTFLHVGVAQPRKNTVFMIEGYCKTFSDDGRTKLIVKSNNGGTVDILKAQFAHRKDIEFIYTNEKPLTTQQMVDLYASADCYVNMSHGEGIGMPDLEALATGIPVIGSNWDGRGTFLDENVGWMVKIDKYVKSYDFAGAEDSGVWADYDMNDYCRILKYAFDHPEEVIYKGKKGAERVKNKFTADISAKSMDDLFMEIYVDRKTGNKIDKIAEHMRTPLKPKPINPTDRILIDIPTKDRAYSLARLLYTLKHQTIKNFDITIGDDTTKGYIYDQPEFMRELMDIQSLGIRVSIQSGHGRNQAFAHNQALNMALNYGYALVFRVDDDIALEPNHLELLFNEFIKDTECKYAAMGGIICEAGMSPEQQEAPSDWMDRIEFAGRIEESTSVPQIFKYPPNVESRDDIQLLYSSYMYRPELVANVGGFPGELSKVAFREETVPIYELYLQGYKLKIVAKAYALHLHEQKGGCRSVEYTNPNTMYSADEIKFRNKVAELKKKYGVK